MPEREGERAAAAAAAASAAAAAAGRVAAAEGTAAAMVKDKRGAAGGGTLDFFLKKAGAGGGQGSAVKQGGDGGAIRDGGDGGDGSNRCPSDDGNGSSASGSSSSASKVGNSSKPWGKENAVAEAGPAGGAVAPNAKPPCVAGATAVAAAAEKEDGGGSWRRACGEVVEDLLARDEEGWFGEPVDADELGIPDYFDVVTEPMDLGTVKAKLGAGQYAGPEAFARDVRLVFENAQRYNESREHVVHQSAAVLAREFERQLAAKLPALNGGAGADGTASSGATSSTNSSSKEVEPQALAPAPAPEGRVTRQRRRASTSSVTVLSSDGSDDEVVVLADSSGAPAKDANNGKEKAEEGKAPSSSAAPVHPFFAKRVPGAKKGPAAPPSGTAAAAAAAAAGAARDGADEEVKSESSSGGGCGGGGDDGDGGNAGVPMTVDLTDEEILTRNPFFLNASQRKRKAELERAEAMELEKKRRKEEIMAFNAGRGLHPFFEVAKAAGVRRPAAREEDGAPGLEWNMLLFPLGYCHITQGDEDGPPLPGAPDAVALPAGGPQVPKLAAAVETLLAMPPPPQQQQRQQQGLGGAQGGAGGVQVVDLDAEEEDEQELRAVTLWRGTGAAANRRENLPLLADEHIGAWTGAGGTGGMEEVVAQLAASAGIAEDGAALHAHLRWLQAQRERAQRQHQHQQWVDKYRPQDTDQLLWELRKTARQLKRWLEGWQEWRRSGAARAGSCSGGSKQRKRRKRRTDDFVVEDDDEDLEEEEGEEDEGSRKRNPRSATVITGPPGSGKTALVYALAQSLGFTVIEINTSQVRSGVEVKKLFSEATQSQHIGGAGGGAAAAASSVVLRPPTPEPKKGKGKGEGKGKSASKGGRGRKRRANKDEEDEKEDEEVVVVASSAPPPGQRMTIILIEEVDLVFEQDAGFHRMLRDLMADAKWPMILTANQAPEWLREAADAGDCHLRLVEPCLTAELAVLLAMVWAAEGAPAPAQGQAQGQAQAEGRELLPIPPFAFRLLARSFPGDVRAALMNLQLWASAIPRIIPPTAPAPAPASLPAPAPEESEAEGKAEGAPMVVVPDDEGNEVPVLGYVPPVVSRVWPYHGGEKGGTRLEITGARFLQESSPGEAAFAPVEVLVGHVPCPEVAVLSDTELQVLTPPCPAGEGAPTDTQYPIVVRVGRFAASSSHAAAANFRYHTSAKSQHCIDSLFPPLRVPGLSRSKGKGKRGGRLVHRGKGVEDGEELEEVGVEEEEEEELSTNAADGTESAPHGRGDGRDDGNDDGNDDGASEMEMEGSGREGGDGGEDAQTPGEPQKQRRKVVVEESDDGSSEDEWTGDVTGNTAAGDESGSDIEQQDEADAALPMEEQQDEEAEGGQTAEDAKLSDAPPRTWKHVPRPPAPEHQVDRAVVDGLAAQAEALSCQNIVQAFAPQLDGDDYVRYPSSSLVRAGVDAEDDEVSPWPRVPGVGQGLAQAMEGLRLATTPAVQQAQPSGGQGLATCAWEAKSATRRELAMNVVLRLVPPSAALPCGGRREVHLDYAPALRAMQLADELNIANAVAGNGNGPDRPRRSTRSGPKSYWTEKLREGKEDLRYSLEELAKTSFVA